MPWTNIARRKHKRETDRYPSDLTDAEWLVLAFLLPAAKCGGRNRTLTSSAINARSGMNVWTNTSLKI